MIPIDKIDNCERMLATGQYQTQQYQNKEDWWLVKYLKLKYEKDGLSEKELREAIKSRWEPIYNTRFDKESVHDYKLYINKHFNEIYNRGKNIVLGKKFNKIIIYQSELDYINSLPAPKWFREFLFLFLGHCKATGNYTYDYAPTKEYMRYLSLKTKNRDAITMTIYNKLKEFNIWDQITVVTKSKGRYFEPEDDEDVKFNFTFPISKKGKVAIEFERQIDLIQRLDLITNLYKCEICGKEFEINNRTQRRICDECWKNSRKQSAKDGMKKYRENKC